jgi:putative drug exporter of the RND superfamily
MASFISRVGRACFRARRWVVVAWLGVLVLVGVLSTTLHAQESNSFSIPGTQSQQAMDLLVSKFPQASGASAQMVFQAPRGSTLSDPAVKAAVLASLHEACWAAGTGQGASVPSLSCTQPQVVYVSDPYVGPTISSDGTIGYATVAFKVAATQISDAAKAALSKAAGPAQAAHVTVAFGGGIVGQETDKNSDAIGLLVAYLVLAITFGSLLAAGLPILTSLIGVAIGLMGINALSGVVALSSTAPILATMIGLAVAIDYALFIVHRYREELGRGLDPEQAIARAVGTAGTAVVFAGITVVIALVGLCVVGIPFLSVMGLCAAGTVIVAVLVAVTLVPALVGAAQRRIRPPKARARSRRGPAARWAALTTGHSVLVTVAVVAVLVVLALPLFSMRLGLPSAGTDPAGSTARTAYTLMSRAFGPGVNGPLLVVVDAPARLNPVAVAEEATKDLSQVPGVASVSPAQQNADHTVTVVVVTPTSGPSSVATEQLVERIRTDAAKVATPYGAKVYVTGATAANIDVSAKLGSALPLYLIVVVGLAFLILLGIFRSVLVPLKAVLGFLLSIGAALGTVVYIFQGGHFGALVALPATSPVISFLPILLVGILFGLAMDYEMFLVSRIREAHVHGKAPRDAVTDGFLESGPVVTAAAIIMFSVFFSFVVSKALITKEIGFSLAVGVLIDAFLVRMTLVPAVLSLLGRRAWWFPRWLDRITPELDVEGARLADPAPTTAASAAQAAAGAASAS